MPFFCEVSVVRDRSRMGFSGRIEDSVGVLVNAINARSHLRFPLVRNEINGND